MNIDKIPNEMKVRPQWIVWAKEKKGDGKYTKIPRNPRDPSRNANVLLQNTWGTLDEAIEGATTDGIAGIAFVLTKNDPLCVIDLDNCLDVNKKPNKWARDAVDYFDTFTEISQSGKGLHLFMGAILKSKGLNKKTYEVYDQSRMICFTCDIFENRDTFNYRQENLNSFLKKFNPPEPEIIINEPKIKQTHENEAQRVSDAIATFCADSYNKAIWNQEGCLHKSQSEYDLAICSISKRLRFSDSLCQELIFANRLKHNANPSKAMRADYIQLTLDKIRADQIAQELYSGCDGTEEDDEDAPKRRLIDINEMLQNATPPTWIVDKYIPENSIIWFAGKQESFKSFVALSLAYHIALGKPWAGQAVTKSKVVYITGEGESGICKRVAGLVEFYGENIPVGQLVISNQPYFMSEPREVFELERSIGHSLNGDSPALVVIDTKAANMIGSDNDPAVINTLINNLRALQRKYHGAILMVDHVGFGDEARPRGPTHQIGAADAVYVQERDKEVSTVKLTVFKAPKDAEEPQAINFAATKVMNLGPRHGNGSTLVLEPTLVEVDKSTLLSDGEQGVLDVLIDLYSDARARRNEEGDHDRIISFERKHWRRQCFAQGMKERTVDRYITACIDKGAVKKKGIFYYPT